jgi:CubicO group peptidase (beta-lactamase class C family)
MTVHFIQNCLKCSLLSFSLLFLQAVRGQNDFSGVESIISQNAKVLGPDVVVLVHKDGRTLFQRESQAFKAKTEAPIASCSKWLTAALVMVMVQEGKLSLDDKVSKYIPLMENYSKGFITIRQCLSHTTGIAADPPGLLRLMERGRFATLEEEVNSFITKKAIETNAGTAFRYSGTGLNIAGRVLEIISKKSFDRLIAEKLLRPLNMRATSFTPESGAVNPSGGARSTAADYMNFLDMILNKGMFNGKQILSEASVLEMQKAQSAGLPVTYKPKVAEGYDYALGEWIQEKDALGKTTVVCSPGLFGTWPWVDIGRGYSAIIFEKGILSEQKRDAYLQIKDAIDSQVK